jgi:glucose-6-phosphate 1-epimerase
MQPLRINLHGARIEELILEGQRIFTSSIRGDGKEGSSHPCIPQFGKTTLFDLPQHGSARNKDFKSKVTSDGIILSQEIEDGDYPKGLSIVQEHSLRNDEYRLTTKILNNSRQNLPVNFAEHFYWDTPNGWEGLKINGTDVTEIVKKDTSIKLKSENVIRIPGQKPIILKQEGFSIFRLWAYVNPKTGEYDKNYVCIEPAEGDPDGKFFGSERSMIKPNESRTTKITIKLNER